MKISLEYGGIIENDINTAYKRLGKIYDAFCRVNEECELTDSYSNVPGCGAGSEVNMTFDGPESELRKAVGIFLDDAGFPMRPPSGPGGRRIFREVLSSRGVKLKGGEILGWRYIGPEDETTIRTSWLDGRAIVKTAPYDLE